mmetsp:Transcript_7594/g.18558  ORF Transcript_7594/g.18558 Transcript_7594/m.18558 type:complete len:201 (+) Transcript_7594:936-1538(+)
MGPPCAPGKDEVMRMTSGREEGGYGRIDTTRLPSKGPDLMFGCVVRYMDTFDFMVTFLGSSPSRARAASKLKEHPSTNPTKSFRQTSVMSVTSASSFPFIQMRYLGRSVRKSAPGATMDGSGEPTSVTSSRGHARELRRQKVANSRANSFGKMTKLAWTKPGARPDVLPLKPPFLHSLRMACAAERSTSSRFLKGKGYAV